MNTWVLMTEGEKGVKGGEKRDSTLVQSQPQAAQHATHQCQTVEVKQSGVCPNKVCERNTIKCRTARLPFMKEAKQEHSDVNNNIKSATSEFFLFFFLQF